MFLETKREGEATAKPTLAGFIAWLETKNPQERYDWGNCEGSCLVGQYGASLGLSWEETCTSGGLYDQVRNDFGVNPHNGGNWTFGAILECARTQLAAHAEGAAD